MARLILISLPIGNLKDITFRAKEELCKVKNLVVEDTRSAHKILDLLGIESGEIQFYSYHDQSKNDRMNELVNLLDRGLDLHLVSEAGSPIISDPAYPLVRAAIAKDHEVISIPGVSAPIVALELSGLPPHPFVFHGFIPRSASEKRAYFAERMGRGETHIFFESPHRGEDTLELLVAAFPDCDLVVARELTKLYETVYRFKACDFETVRPQLRFQGEVVILCYLPKGDLSLRRSSAQIQALAQKCLEEKGKSKALAKLLAEILDGDSKVIYSELIGKGE